MCQRSGPNLTGRLERSAGDLHRQKRPERMEVRRIGPSLTDVNGRPVFLVNPASTPGGSRKPRSDAISATPPGSKSNDARDSGGIALLNPRLMAVTPLGSGAERSDFWRKSFVGFHQPTGSPACGVERV
jgi:hypothetical protein